MNDYINLELSNSSRQKPIKNYSDLNKFQKINTKMNKLENEIEILKEKNKVNIFENILEDKPVSTNNETNIIYKTIPIIFLSIYLMIAANFIGEMMPCYLRTTYFENMFFKHLILILSIFFVTVYTNPDIFSLELYKLVIFSFLFYSIFILTTKCEEHIWFISTISLIVISLISILGHKIKNKKTGKNENEKNILKYIDSNFITSLFVIFILYTFGFLVYLSEKKYEYKERFSYLKFFIGVHDCGKEHKGIIHNRVKNMKLFDKIKLLRYLFN